MGMATIYPKDFGFWGYIHRYISSIPNYFFEGSNLDAALTINTILKIAASRSVPGSRKMHIHRCKFPSNTN